jgi:hypothetical protein
LTRTTVISSHLQPSWYWRPLERFGVESEHNYILQDVVHQMAQQCSTIENQKFVAAINRPLRCAGMNRHEAEDERALRERSSDPLGLESCAGYREVLSEA